MGRRLTAVAVVIALMQASCLFVVPRTRRHERSAYCADPKTKVAIVHVWKGARLDWVGCGGSGCGDGAIIGLLLSPITLAISGLYTILVVGFSHDRNDRHLVRAALRPRRAAAAASAGGSGRPVATRA